MNPTIKTVFGVLLLIFLSFIPAKAQVEKETFATITISNKSFAEHTHEFLIWGESVRIVSLSVFINGQPIGYLFTSELNDTGKSVLTYEIPLSSSIVTPKFQIHYIYHRWGTNAGSYDNFPIYPISQQELSPDGFSETQTFNVTGLEMEVDWKLDYKIEISPFKPVVNKIEEKKCYNMPFMVSMRTNSPIFYNDEKTLYEWEYGEVTIDTIENPQFFYVFLNEIADSLEYQYSANGNIIYAIRNTNYKFMVEYLSLYDGLPDSKSSIAYQLLIGIVNNNSGLTSEDRAFLYRYFRKAALTQSVFPPPYTLITSVKYWITLATGKNKTDPVEFKPEDRLAVLRDKAKIGFRARAYKTITGQRRPYYYYGPWSGEVSSDILPAPPTGLISSDSSCVYNPTAEITISGITSPVNTSYYTYRIIDADSTFDSYGANSKDFYGVNVNVNKHYSPGDFKLYLTYADVSIKGCYSEKLFTIDSLPELAYDVTQKDVSCPGSSDGSISVNISKMAGDYKIETNEVTVSNKPDYIFSGLAAKNYTVKVSDFCYPVPKETSITIDEPSRVVINSVTPKKPTCISSPNGGFKVEVSGVKNNKYDYYIFKESEYPSGKALVSDTAQGPTWENYSLPGGRYIINVRDNASRDCPGVSTTVHVLAPVLPLGFSPAGITNVTCFGGSNGEIEVTASGGSGSYRFNIGSVFLTVNHATFDSLSAGNYTVSVRNSDETCKDVASAEVTVGTNPKIDISLIPVDVTCYGEGNGQIRTEVSGGTNSFKPYDWEIKANGGWIPHTFSDPSSAGLYPGEYRLKVTDSDYCSVYDSTTIIEPGLLYITSVKPHDITCYGGEGSIEIDAQGGNGGYNFSYYENGGAFFENLPPDSTLPAGTYKLKVTDSKGCEARWEEKEVEKEVKITGPDAALAFTTTLSDYNGFNISCNGGTKGSITIIANGGNGYKGNGDKYSGYSYMIEGRQFQSDSNIVDISARTYTVFVADNRGCEVSKQVTFTQPEKLELSLLAKDDIKCFGEATGKIAASAAGGVEPYLYQLNSMGFYSAPVFSGLYADTYTITVKDGNGCPQNLLAAVEHKNQQIQTIIIPQDVRCFGESNGKIAATVTGGSGSFDMLWEKKINGNWKSEWESVANLEKLGPGNYRFKVTDSDNCSVSDSIIIKEPDFLTISKINLHDIICYGETGNIDIETEGGNAGYKFFYSENNGITYTEFTSGSPLKAATYKLKVTDSKGCETAWSENMTITNPPEALGLTWFAKDYNGYNVSCYGNNNGLISVTPSGGNGARYKGYSYLLSGRSSQTDSVFANLTAGPYNISLTDARGCTISKQVTLTQAISELFLRASSLVHATCIDDANGRITLTASGGGSPYTYASGDNAFVSENEFTNLGVSNYNFTVKDVNGCTQTFYTSIVNTVPKMDITGIITDAKCFRQNSGAINVNISGGAMPFTYRWKENSSTNPFIGNLYKGNYTLSVTDAAGCVAEQLFEIHEPVLPLSVTAISQAACALTPNGAIIPAAGGGTPPYLYAVDDQSHMYNTSLFLAYSGRHKVFAADANNCLAETEVTINERNKMPFVNFMLATSRYERDTLVVIDVSMPKPDNVTWEFSPEATVIATNPFDAKIRYNATGIYPVKMTGHFETCDYTVEKLLNIAPYDPLLTGKDKYLTGIESVQITPNPNNGQFKVKVKLYTKQQIHIKVLDFYSKICHSSRYPAGIEFEQDISIPGVLPGTYVLWVVSDNDSKALLFIISQ